MDNWKKIETLDNGLVAAMTDGIDIYIFARQNKRMECILRLDTARTRALARLLLTCAAKTGGPLEELVVRDAKDYDELPQLQKYLTFISDKHQAIENAPSSPR